MFSPPEHSRNLSLRLSEVLDDIGVNEETVMNRRRLRMLIEAGENIFGETLSEKELFIFNFGSQTEGSTTEGLMSDIDNLFCMRHYRVIQDWSEWEQGKNQFLMIQDDTTSPGYCLLQLVRPDEPFPARHVHNDELFIKDSKGRVLLRHSYCLVSMQYGIRHGPAGAIQRGAEQHDDDYVFALNCSSWPKEANPWLQRQSVSGWPTEDMKRYSSEQGCFVVPVGSRTGLHQDTEWRISTSFAERCLMFNLNMTQIRCYVLMKMILKTFLKPRCGEAVSSFMCKNILFHCIANSLSNSAWDECRLLTCLNQCLQALFDCILTEQCPHFIIPGNNLLADKLTTAVKRQVLEIMSSLTLNIEQSLRGVRIDDLGERLYVKSGRIPTVYLRPPYVAVSSIAANNVSYLALKLTRNILFLQRKFPQDSRSLIIFAHRLCQIFIGGSQLYQVATSLCTPFLCSVIGSRKASSDLQHSQIISPEALTWLSLGENSGISWGRLRLASALYCSGDLQRCEGILAALKEQIIHSTFENICHCYGNSKTMSEDYGLICHVSNEDVVKHNIAFCVPYSRSEINCTPKEMKYEMFRSTEQDLPYRDDEDDWMDYAVVDSLPHLFFLQYKVYSQLQRPADQQRALEDLARTIDTERNLGHRETAWNLLGQCMEQENKNQVAVKCYTMSLRVRRRNNAAKWLICRLLAHLLRG